MSSLIFAILAAIIWGIVPILEKIGLSKINPWVGLFYRCLGVCLGMVFLSFFLFKANKSINSKQIFFLVVSGLLASVVAQIFFYLSLKELDVSKVVPIVGSYPLVSFILGIILLKEPITLTKLIAIILIILGVWLISD